MLSIYKKCEKSLSNPSGIVEITNINELSKPFLLCISAQDIIDKSIYGIMREGAQAARVCTSQEDAPFKLSSIPVDFLGIRFQADEQYKYNYREIVDKLIYPYLMSSKNIKKQARNINIMTYCDGTITYEGIEEYLTERLEKDGYSSEDINDILSQICVVALETMANTDSLKATTVKLVDVNDNEISTEETDKYIQSLESSKRNSLFGYLTRKNNLLYIYNGNGRHSLKEFFSNKNFAKPVLCGVISKILELSIQNSQSDGLVSITPYMIFEMIKKYSNESKSIPELLDELDKEISYGGCAKYSESEMAMRRELDSVCKELLRTQQELKYSELYRQEREEKISKTIANIKKYSSETTFYQILVSSKLWQTPSGIDVFGEPSDKEIREQYNKIEGGPKLQ